jgi:glycosidase
MHEFYREIHDKILSKYDCFTVGELPHTPSTEHVRRYISASYPQLSEVFQFDIVDIDAGKIQRYDLAPAVEVTGKNWHLSELKAIINKWQTFIDGTDAWTTVFMENQCVRLATLNLYSFKAVITRDPSLGTRRICPSIASPPARCWPCSMPP